MATTKDRLAGLLRKSFIRTTVTNRSREKWSLETKGNIVNERSVEKPEDRESHHQVELFASTGTGSPAWTILSVPSF